MATRKSGHIIVGGHSVPFSNPEKILFPKSGITKREYVKYYQSVAPYMLMHIRKRPLSLERFPEGVGGELFYQKEIPEYFPEYFQRVDVKPDEDEPKHYGTAVNEASIVYLANMVTIPHIWMSCMEHLREPDRMVWDLDPMGLGFTEVKTAAKLVRYLLGELGLNPHPMLTGSRGLHVVVFVEPEYDVDVIFDFTRGVAQLITRKLPQLFTVEYSKSKRGQKIYIDYHRNVYAQTAVAPYAVRAIEGAPVAMPITWEDVEDEALTAQSFPMPKALERLEKQGQSWTGQETRDDLGPAREKLQSLLEKSRVRV